jgi:hypothetical protein
LAVEELGDFVGDRTFRRFRIGEWSEADRPRAGGKTDAWVA